VLGTLQTLKQTISMQVNHVMLLDRSLKDMLYRRRMERQLAAARGMGPGGEKPPDEDGPAGGVLPTAGAKGGYVPPSVRWAYFSAA